MSIKDQNSSSRRPQQQLQQRVILLLDLDCFYAQCERIRLGFTGPDDHKTCCLALLQWNSCLAVSYPARRYGIKRGDSFEHVASKSSGKCMTVHVPLLETTDSSTSRNHSLEGDYESVYMLSADEQQKARDSDIGRRRYASEGKACLERYRVASRRIFEVVMECLGLDGNNNTASSTSSSSTITSTTSSSSSSSGIVFEKASIDEFFLDVTNVCNNPQHDLWQKIAELSTQKHASVVVGRSAGEHDNIVFQKSEDVALERGCQLAHYIRQSVFQTLGFTLSAGISINKMIAKLAASYDKPNGQAVVYPAHVMNVMKETKLSKVRNFGGKLGKALTALLPASMESPTMGSIARLFSLPQLEEHFETSTARFIFRACRGCDDEPVEAKNTHNVVKSITAFKSLPRSGFEDVQDSGFIQWLLLLVQEVVTRVHTDAERNHRYPRNCTIHYGLEGQLKAGDGSERSRLDMKSFRIPFPAQRLSTAERVTQLIHTIPAKLIQREGGTTTGNGGMRKRIRPVRIGVCATEMIEEVNKNGSITNFFPTKVPDKTTKTPNFKVVSTQQQQRQQQQQTDTAQQAEGVATVASTEEKTKEDESGRLARELQAAFDKEPRAFNTTDAHASSQERTTLTVSPKKRRHCSTNDSSVAAANHTVSEEPLDQDLALAQKLQANYDRENEILGAWESRHRQCQALSRQIGGERQVTNKKVKTKKISYFLKRKSSS